MFRFRASIWASALCLAILPGSAQPPAKPEAPAPKPAQRSGPPWTERPEPIPGIYSNLKYVDELENLDGMEVMIVPGPDREGVEYEAFVQIAEGGRPSTALVPLKVTGWHVELTLPRSVLGSTLKLQGEFTADSSSLVLHRAGRRKAYRLRRGKSLWQ